MKRAEKNYKGKRRQRGVSGEKAIIFVMLVLVAMLAMTIRANSHWTGMSAGEQIHQALFVTKDWE